MLCPKPKRRKKVRTWLRLRRKALRQRGSFKGYLPSEKPRKRCRSDFEVIQYALQMRQERLTNPTRAETALSQILRDLGIAHEREKIFLNGDRFILADVYLPGYNLTIECDGERLHKSQERYDNQRAMWLARAYGVGTVRFGNKEILSGKTREQLIMALGLYDA